MSVFGLITSAAAAAKDAHAEASAGTLPQLDPTWWPSQLFWLAITFGILYWLMSGSFLPRIGGAIEERRDRIADDLDHAGDFKRQAEDAEKAYETALADARAKAQTIAAQTRAEVDEEIAKMQAETDAKLDEQLAAAEERINAMKENAAAKVREAAAETTQAIVEALIDETPTPEAVSKAIDTASAA